MSGEVTRAVLSLGSNIEPRHDHLSRALEKLATFPATKVIAASEIEETEPVDVPDAFRRLRFLNQVVFVDTALAARDFSNQMHQVEDELGRVRTVRNGPRTIDIDLIDWGGTASDDPELTLPHPRAAERDFVSRPWRELVRGLATEKGGPVPI